jgi:hypothetical protein
MARPGLFPGVPLAHGTPAGAHGEGTAMIDLPMGGTTGLSHEHSHAIDECAAYLAAVPPTERPRPLVPAMRQMFGISSSEVCQAIRQSHDIVARPE